MAASFTGEKTHKQQTIEQALRRLKYLHTSLAPHEGKTTQNGQKLDKLLCTKGLQPVFLERSTVPRKTPEKQCFLSLQPKTVRKHREKGKSRAAKYKQNKKAICTGRAPLQATTYGRPVSQTADKEKFESNSNIAVVTSRNPAGRGYSSKSASAALCTVDPYKCAECFANDFEHAPKKQSTKKYYTNIRINRVTFSARPSGANAKSARKESKLEVPRSCVFNGWGVRPKRDSFTRGNRANNYSKCHTKDDNDVTAGLKTLKLETRNDRIRKDYTGETIPQPPPTPVRQIDIKLPQGLVVKYQLSEDE